MSLIQLKGDRRAEGSIGSLERDERGEFIGEPLDAISLQLHEPPSPTAVWAIELWANTGHSAARVGTVITGSPSPAVGHDRVVAMASCPGARAWTIVASRFLGPPNAQAVLRAALSRYGGALGVVALNRASVIGQTAAGYTHDAGVAPGVTAVPGDTRVTHISAEAGPAGATVTIGAQPPITVGPGQVFTLPAAATRNLIGPVDITFAGDIVNRFVSWGL